MTRLRLRSVLFLAVLVLLAVLGALAARVPDRLRAARVCPRPSPERPAGPVAPLPAATSGLLLVANQQAGSASIVDLAKGAVAHLPAGEEPHEVAVSPDGRWGVVPDVGRRFDGHHLTVIDMAAKKVARRIDLGEHHGLHDVAFLPGSSTRVVVTAQGSGYVVEVDIEKGAITAAIGTRAGSSHLLALAGDGRTLFTANEESVNLSRLDLAARKFIRHYPFGHWPEGLAITPDGREVWVGSHEEELVKVIDASTGSVAATIPGFGTPNRIVISPNGKLAVITDPLCDIVNVVDVRSRRVIGTITGLNKPHGVEIAPDNRVAFVTLGREKAVAVIDLEARRVLARYPVQKWPDGVGWGPAPPGFRTATVQSPSR